MPPPEKEQTIEIPDVVDDGDDYQDALVAELFANLPPKKGREQPEPEPEPEGEGEKPPPEVSEEVERALTLVTKAGGSVDMLTAYQAYRLRRGFPERPTGLRRIYEKLINLADPVLRALWGGDAALEWVSRALGMFRVEPAYTLERSLQIDPADLPRFLDGEPVVLYPSRRVISIYDLPASVRREFRATMRDWIARGGPGSGHHGHAGRPGEVGGSEPGSGGRGRRLQGRINTSRLRERLKKGKKVKLRGYGDQLWQVGVIGPRQVEFIPDRDTGQEKKPGWADLRDLVDVLDEEGNPVFTQEEIEQMLGEPLEEPEEAGDSQSPSQSQESGATANDFFEAIKEEHDTSTAEFTLAGEDDTYMFGAVTGLDDDGMPVIDLQSTSGKNDKVVSGADLRNVQTTEGKPILPAEMIAELPGGDEAESSEETAPATAEEPTTQVGITSARPGKEARVVFEDMRAFANALDSLEGTSDVVVQPGLGGWEGGSEPTWVVEYKGNGEAMAMLAVVGKQFDQDAILVMHGPDEGGENEPVVEWHFSDPVIPAEREAVEGLLVANGIGGWTWYRKPGGFSVLRAVNISTWGGNRDKHLTTADRLGTLFEAAGMPFERTDGEVSVTVMEREGENAYDNFIGG